MIFSGGHAALVRVARPETDAAREVLAMFGQDATTIEFESRSRNTAENAAFTAEMLGADRDRPWILVTSAFHMPRALGCFRRAGVNVIPYPADYRAGRLLPPYLAGDAAAQFAKFGIFAKEIFGLAAYYWTGRTDALLPR